MRDLAQDLIRQGCHVFPVKPRDKVTLRNCDRCHPDSAPCRDKDTACPCWPDNPCHGFRAATNDPTTADQWWSRWPTANVGIYPWPSRHVVLDLDVKPIPAPATLVPAALGLGDIRATSGVDLFAQVMRHLGGIDRLDTRITRTPSGGMHVWFTAPTGMTIGSSKGQVHRNQHVSGLGWQIDVRAHGGYVVAPGSTTEHGSYVLARDLPPMPLPDWLARWLALASRADTPPAGHATLARGPWPVGTARGARIATAALIDECAELAAMTPESGRNNALNRAAYKLGGYIPGGHLTEADVTAALTDAARACGLRDCAIARTIRSGLTAGMKQARHLDNPAA